MQDTRFGRNAGEEVRRRRADKALRKEARRDLAEGTLASGPGVREALSATLCVMLRPADTSPEAWAIVEEGLRRMTPEQRVRRAIDLTILSHQFALANIRREHPDEDERTHRLRLAARIIDPETMKRAFRWPPEGHDER